MSHRERLPNGEDVAAQQISLRAVGALSDSGDVPDGKSAITGQRRRCPCMQEGRRLSRAGLGVGEERPPEPLPTGERWRRLTRPDNIFNFHHGCR